MARTPLTLSGEKSRSDPPLFTGDLEVEARTMNKGRAEQLGGKLSFPSKMDCPASTCRVGSILAQQPDSTCADCYAAKGTFRFKNVKGILEDNYEKLWNPEWTPAILAQIRWEARDRFRWFMSGDLQGENHLRNIIQICDATRHLRHWLPTREIAVVLACKDEIPDNLTIRYSAPMVDGPPPTAWPWTSTVVSEATETTCLSSIKGGNCADHGCDACWDRGRKNVAYLKH